MDERDDRLVADGTTTQVMYDYATRPTVPIPAALRDALAPDLTARPTGWAGRTAFRSCAFV